MYLAPILIRLVESVEANAASGTVQAKPASRGRGSASTNISISEFKRKIRATRQRREFFQGKQDFKAQEEMANKTETAGHFNQKCH